MFKSLLDLKIGATTLQMDGSRTNEKGAAKVNHERGCGISNYVCRQLEEDGGLGAVRVSHWGWEAGRNDDETAKYDDQASKSS
jgi:hypothetical protein